MARSLKQEKEVPRPLDDWTRNLIRECGYAVAWWLDAKGGLSKPIKSLTIEEFEGIAWAAICRYTDIREAKRMELGVRQDVFPGELDQLDRYVTKPK